MARRGRLWGAERIRGELLKLGIKVSKRTIQTASAELELAFGNLQGGWRNSKLGRRS